jgi:protein-S-isoprenylcysteine O-methyltransferase Ste14
MAKGVLVRDLMESPQTLRVGQALFKFRSFTPVPVILLGAFLLWRSRGVPGPGGASIDAWLNIIGIALALLGQALRFYTLGLVPEGTSGQGNQLEAVTLNTQGPYAFVRNPLYVGNLGICLGLLLVAHDPLVYALGLLFFFGEYHFIIRAEENFLRSRFAETFDDYCRRVRRWWPRLSRAYSGQLRQSFDVSRAFKKEHNPFAAWATGVVVLLAWELWARGTLTQQAWVILVAIQIAVLVFFGVVKAYKRRWIFQKRRQATVS